MSLIDEAYVNYLRWIISLRMPDFEPLTPTEYEKATQKISDTQFTNTDAILRNNNRKRDKEKP